jgi:hypothetical protein
LRFREDALPAQGSFDYLTSIGSAARIPLVFLCQEIPERRERFSGALVRGLSEKANVSLFNRLRVNRPG